MMLNTASRVRVIGTLWFAAVAVIVASSVAVGANLSTSALLLLGGIVPAGVALLIGFGAPPPTVAEVLYAVTTQKDGR
jgi:hypothetical protein